MGPGHKGFITSTALLVILSGICWAATAETEQEHFNNQIRDRVTELRQIIISRQKSTGTWSRQEGQAEEYHVGVAALALMALKYAGLPDNHPAIVNAVEYITNHYDGKVYSEGIVPCALEIVDPVLYKDRIRASVAFLLKSQRPNGAWGYADDNSPYSDNSNSFFAALGLAAAEHCGIIVPDRTKALAIAYWRKSMTNQGAWGYKICANCKSYHESTIPMTCAGICGIHLLGYPAEKPGAQCGIYQNNQETLRATRWLAGMLQEESSPWKNEPYYNLYNIERVGMLLNTSTIGNFDWYHTGVKLLMKKSPSQSISDNALEILFLTKPFSPAAITKWQWNGDWNNDHDDMKNLVKQAAKDLEIKLSCNSARLDAADPAVSESSVIFVNGHKPLVVNPDEARFLARLLQQGGVLIGEACCGSAEFRDSFVNFTTNQLLPGSKAEFVPVDKSHPLSTAFHQLDPGPFKILQLKADTCRPVKVLLITKDLSCALQGEQSALQRGDAARKQATNLIAWSLKTAPPKRTANDDQAPTLNKPQPSTTGQGARFIHAFGRLKHHGDWDSDSAMYESLAKTLAAQPAAPQFDGEIQVDPLGRDLFQSAILFMNGHTAPGLTPEETSNIRNYLQNGGALLASACCTSKEFDVGFRSLIAKILPNDKLETVPENDPLFTKHNSLKPSSSIGTKPFEDLYGNKPAPIYGINRDGRWIILYSAVDICCAFTRESNGNTICYEKDVAGQLWINLLNAVFEP